MNKSKPEFNVVAVDQNILRSLVVFEINQVSSIVRKTNVGQFVQSCPFELTFPTSIGKSKWVVILFPNGQYDAGKANDLIYVYLKMVYCEHQSAEFKFDVQFRLGSEYATVTKRNQTLRFDNVKTRWIGTKLLNTSEMIINGSRFIHDDILLMSVDMTENHSKHESSAGMSYNNNYLMESEPYVTSEIMDWTSRYERNSYQSSAVAAADAADANYDIYLSKQPSSVNIKVRFAIPSFQID